jgi:N-acetylglucosaminyldiphosphoundecaprenol N-acetyl-beta-D-mannosaminyltransferase
MLDPQMRRHDDLMIDGIAINTFSMQEAIDCIIAAAQDGENFSVFTLNLDHVEKLNKQPDFRAAYRRARFVTADGFPIVILGRLAGAPIERTTGADLVHPICAEAGRKGLPVYLFGANRLTLHRAERRLSRRYQGLRIVGASSPSPTFDPYSSEADEAIERIRASGARLCFAALGAPRQEIFAARCLDKLPGTGLLCIGAALDFIANTQNRAPRFTQKAGLEWAWRMMRDPRRLGPRYARCMAVIPRLAIRSIPQILNARMRKTA